MGLSALRMRTGCAGADSLAPLTFLQPTWLSTSRTGQKWSLALSCAAQLSSKWAKNGPWRARRANEQRFSGLKMVPRTSARCVKKRQMGQIWSQALRALREAAPDGRKMVPGALNRAAAANCAHVQPAKAALEASTDERPKCLVSGPTCGRTGQQTRLAAQCKRERHCSHRNSGASNIHRGKATRVSCSA